MEHTELIDRYLALRTPLLCDALYDLAMTEQVLPSSLRPLFPQTRMAGVAYTVLGREFDPIGWQEGIPRIRSYLDALARIGPGCVLVSATPTGRVGHFGDLTGTAVKARGCTGVVLDGNLRDTEGLRELGLQVFYRDLSPLNAIGRWEMLECERPVQIGDVVINPGDMIIGDFDGIIVVPSDDAERVLLRAEEIASSEGLVRSEATQGMAPWESFERHGHI